jgi:two-component sensor histidine kinase
VDEQTKDLSRALSEKEVLIKEIHHRVKNNLAVVSGLLELQSWSLPDGIAKLAMQESKLRVMAMSKVHEYLYQNEDLARVDFRRFLDDLVKSVASTMKKPGQDIEIILYSEEIHLNVNIGIPVGLMVNEMVSNSYKHAFKGKKEGSISLSLEEQESSYFLVLKDDGIGSEDNLLERETESLGTTLIKSLASQVNAIVTYSGINGAKYEVTIPKDQD